jgi:uncharacterized protein (DUF58 family)
MLSYLHIWTPAAVVVGIVVILTTPFLGLIALLVILLTALTALAAAAIAAPFLLGRSVHRLWRAHRDVIEQGAVLSPAQRHNPQLVISDAEGGTR